MCVKIQSAQHLGYNDKTNLGSFYTPLYLVGKLYELLDRHSIISKIDTVLEPSCGYGAFFNHTFNDNICLIGADVDYHALEIAKKEYPNVQFYEQNLFYNVSRNNYGITDTDKILIIGNPPYNDKTSHIKNEIKTETAYPVDSDIQTRDIGLSSLLAYAKLEPEYIAVLHPLSYLIKKSNFGILHRLMNKYQLIDSLVFSSQEFSDNSKITGFPIMTAVYQKNNHGTVYADIEKMRFQTLEGKHFSLKQFDYVDNYISKYPVKFKEKDFNGYLFYTLRDINALKRSRTFITEYIPNAVQIQPDKLPYYHYIDVFKDYIERLPYYMGNMNIPIDNQLFHLFRNDFILLSKAKHSELFRFEVNAEQIAEAKKHVEDYFLQLFKTG